MHGTGDGTGEIRVFQPDGALVRTYALPPEADPQAPGIPLLAVHGETIAFSNGHTLILIRHGQIVAHEQFESPIVQLQATKLVQPVAFLVNTNDGAWRLTSNEPDGWNVKRLPPPTSSPDLPRLATLLDNGDLVAGDASVCLIYRATPPHTLYAEACFTPPPHSSQQTVVDIAATTKRRFGALTVNGLIKWYG